LKQVGRQVGVQLAPVGAVQRGDRGIGYRKSVDLKESLSDSRLVVRPPGQACTEGIHHGQRSSKPPIALETRHEEYRLIQIRLTRTFLMTSITPFLWFDNNVPEAVAFYKSVFPNARIEAVNDFMATFELEGQRFNALNGGPKYKFNEAISFFISVESQEEVDYFWNRLTADSGKESKCGWLKDKFGLSWQVVPAALGRYLSDPDRKKADRAMQAMMKMQKIVIADLEKAYAG
jgi:predicted 3-demethylubiquinone-9 3-methyltransferase (glyoxalase superfamily)